VKDRDLAATLAGGGIGATLLATVRWEAVPFGEAVKIGVAVFLIVLGYFMYRNQDPPPTNPVLP